MCGVPEELRAAERARWLADISAALEEAQRLLVALQNDLAPHVEMRELHARIGAAQVEVQSLRVSRSVAGIRYKGPDWTELPPWDRAVRDS